MYNYGAFPFSWVPQKWHPAYYFVIMQNDITVLFIKLILWPLKPAIIISVFWETYLKGSPLVNLTHPKFIITPRFTKKNYRSLAVVTEAKIFMIYVYCQNWTKNLSKNRPRSGRTVMTILYLDIQKVKVFFHFGLTFFSFAH